MNPISWVDIVGFIILPIIGYGLMKINGLQHELSEHKVEVATNYVQRQDFNKALDKIDNALEKIYERVNTIAERRSTDRKESE